jgi:DNA-binding MltR family transcriptional regulator
MARNPKLRDLSRLPPEYDDIIALNDAFLREQQPITTAILGAVMVEHELERLIRSKLKHQDNETWKMLIADNGPLRSFYTKIAMGYALGIYDKNMRGDLNIVRSIRNAFAHSKKLIQFDDLAVIGELRKATRSAIPKGMWKAKGSDILLYKSLCIRLSLKLIRIYSRRMKSTKHTPTTSEVIKALLGGKPASWFRPIP